MKTKFDIIIVGGGLVGLTAAIACAQSGLSIAVGDKTQAITDMVAYEGSLAEPWKIHFDEADKLGSMVENIDLRAALLARFDAFENLHMIAPAEISSHNHVSSGVDVHLKGQKSPLTAKLLIAADGRNSHLRRAAGITVQATPYNQRALVTIIKHSLPHDGLALQRFMRGGPLAVLPLPQNRSQIVWSDRAEAIEALEQLSQIDFIDILQERMGDYLGDITLETLRQSYPLGRALALRISAV